MLIKNETLKQIEKPRRGFMFIETNTQTQKFDPIRGRTIFSYNSFYKHAIPTELLIFQA